MTLTTGQSVRVYPHGSPAQAITGTVKLISGNQRSIAVAFEHIPPFAFNNGGAIGIHPEPGVALLATRVELNGKPWGPWIELAGGEHYEIESETEE